jgi:hypothetical protein
MVRTGWKTFQSARQLATTDLHAAGAPDHRDQGQPPVGARQDRLFTGHPSLHGAPGPIQIRGVPAVLAGPCHGQSDPPLRAPQPPGPAPHGHQKLGRIPDDGGHLAPLTGPKARSQDLCGHSPGGQWHRLPTIGLNRPAFLLPLSPCEQCGHWSGFLRYPPHGSANLRFGGGV